MEKIQFRGKLQEKCSIVYTFDYSGESLFTPKPLAADALPETSSTWTAEELAAYRAGTIVQFEERWLPRRKIITEDSKTYQVITEREALKKLLGERYVQYRSGLLIRNRRENEDRLALSLGSDDVWEEMADVR